MIIPDWIPVTSHNNCRKGSSHTGQDLYFFIYIFLSLTRGGVRDPADLMARYPNIFHLFLKNYASPGGLCDTITKFFPLFLFFIFIFIRHLFLLMHWIPLTSISLDVYTKNIYTLTSKIKNSKIRATHFKHKHNTQDYKYPRSFPNQQNFLTASPHNHTKNDTCIMLNSHRKNNFKLPQKKWHVHNFILLHAENSPHEKKFPTYKKILTKKLPKQTKTMYGPTQIQKTPTQNLIVVLYYKKSFFLNSKYK